MCHTLQAHVHTRGNENWSQVQDTRNGKETFICAYSCLDRTQKQLFVWSGHTHARGASNHPFRMLSWPEEIRMSMPIGISFEPFDNNFAIIQPGGKWMNL